MFASLLKPKVDLASLAIRWGIAAIFLVHGYFKLVQQYPLLQQFSMEEQTIIGWAEVAIGGMMFFGLFSRIAALAAIAHQIGAIVMVTGRRALAGFDRRALAGFDMNMTGADYTRVGPEFNLVIVALCLGVILLGSGAFSVDACLMRLMTRSGSDAPAPAAPKAMATGAR
jgi:uncharacterized membrane protein YphA (DoxX/SURF4 family)